MSQLLQYDGSEAEALLPKRQPSAIQTELLAARDEVFADVDLWKSGGSIPDEKQPLDAGCISMPEDLLAEYSSLGNESVLGQIDTTAAMLRENLDRVLVLGIGGSYMGARALFEALCHPYHNELSREDRGGTPKIYFEGNNVDNDTVQGLMDVLSSSEWSDSPWGIVVISKSGGTLETASAFRVFREALEDAVGPESDEIKKFIVPVTGDVGKLRQLSDGQGYQQTFPIPDGVGGRFSILSAVGLLPAALMGLDIKKLLKGAADMTQRFRDMPVGENPVLDYTAICHLMEVDAGRTIRVMSTWGNRLEASGLWYDQLLSESLGKAEQGATPITVVNTRDLHSRGQQHQEGMLDKLITNVWVDQPSMETVALPAFDDDNDQLNRFAGKPMSEFLAAAFAGTNQAYKDVGRPTANIVLPQLDEYALGQLFQMLMLATVLEGRLIGINPYGQPGVEAYKNNMNAILSRDL